MTALDAGVGRVLEQLDEEGLADKTLVVVASDNGGRVGPRQPELEVASNSPFRDGRTSVYEGGVRTPCILRWPGQLPANEVVREPLANMDLFVLALRAAGLEAPQDRAIDGRDPIPVLRDGAPSPHRNLYFRYRETSGIRQGRWKLVRRSPEDALELYDLSVDFAETTNLAASQPDQVKALWGEFVSWLSEVETDN